jgi:hypothetical protein
MKRTDGAQRIAAAFAAAGGAAAAADAVERRLIASGVPGTERPVSDRLRGPEPAVY